MDELYRRLQIHRAHLKEQLELWDEKIGKIIQRRKLLSKALLVERRRGLGGTLCGCGIVGTFYTVILMFRLADPADVFFENLLYIILALILFVGLVFVGAWLFERKPINISEK
ncbi:MAG: hypothetical protein Q8Q95_01045 [bacterium]|nr:hypothetical protein [bacterium]